MSNLLTLNDNSRRRLIGDVHGLFNRYEQIIKNSPYPTVQVGDMGVGFMNFHGEFTRNPPYDKMVEGDHTFIRGNHDNPSVCRKHTQFIEDGKTLYNAMFIGGALSIDRHLRIEGINYWKDEELSASEFNQIFIEYENIKPTVMITHECPQEVAALMADKKSFKLQPQFASITRDAFNDFFETHRPKLWVFGHWHMSFDAELHGTRFICLNELETVDVDLKTGEVFKDESSK